MENKKLSDETAATIKYLSEIDERIKSIAMEMEEKNWDMHDSRLFTQRAYRRLNSAIREIQQAIVNLKYP
jgi:vacuolar-type H+-ATPase subunit I/STV1